MVALPDDAQRHDLLAFTDDPAPSTARAWAENHRRDLVTQIDALCGDLPYPFAIFADNEDGTVEEVLGWGLDLPDGTVIAYASRADGRMSQYVGTDADLAADRLGGYPAWLVRNRWATGRTPA